MDLTLNAEQEAVRDAVRAVLRDRLPEARLRAVMAAEPPIDTDLWREAAGLGWFGLALPEAVGGAGYGLPEAMLLFHEIGRTVAPGPWLGTVVAAQALAQSGAEGSELRAVLEALLAGRTRAAVVDDPAEALGSGDRLDGTVDGVADAAGIDGVLVLGANAVRWTPVSAAQVTTAPCMDPTRRLGRVRFAGVTARSAGSGAAHWRQVATVLAAAEAAGVAERTLEASVEYAKVRQQFGRPIGSFQAIKHRCADMAVRAEVARSAVTYAAVALAERIDDAAFHVHVAKALATEAAIANATDNVQNHGGMGYTWEASAHLYLKRARLLEHCFGTRTAHLDALARPWRRAS